MLRGYRGIIVAFVGLAFLCGAKPPTKDAQGHDSTQQAAPAPSPTFAAYDGYDPDPCYRAKDHDAADLCAQWRASIAAEKAAHEARRATNWSIVATFLSALALFAVWISLRQTNRSLGSAREANEIARDTSRRSLRAYLGIISFKCNGFFPESKPAVRVKYRNAGQSPAIDVEARAFFKLTGAGPNFVKFWASSLLDTAKLTIMPGCDGWIDLTSVRLSAADLLAINAGKGYCVIAGHIRYKDVFGKTHRTMFRQYVQPGSINQNGSALIIPASRGNIIN